MPDASVLVSAVTDSGPAGLWSEQFLREALISPDLALVETVNVLRRLTISGRIDQTTAVVGARALLSLDIEPVPFEPFFDRIWSLRENLTSYDAWYVAVAERLDVPLVTLDRKLAASPVARCEFLTPPNVP